MSRYLLNLLTALSILLCVATVALWVRSHRMHDTVTWVPRHDLLECFTMPGRVYLRHSTGTWSNGGGVRLTTRPLSPEDREFRWQDYVDARFLGGGYRYQVHAASVSREITLPLPYLLAPCAIAPAVRSVSRIRTRKRLRAGLCPRCAYDLRATPGVCPECGRAGP